jgi:hypothetical protein
VLEPPELAAEVARRARAALAGAGDGVHGRDGGSVRRAEANGT